MDAIIAGLIEKVGLDEETAHKVIEFLKEHADELPALLAKSGLADQLPEGVADAIPGGLGGLFGK